LKNKLFIGSGVLVGVILFTICTVLIIQKISKAGEFIYDMIDYKHNLMVENGSKKLQLANKSTNNVDKNTIKKKEQDEKVTFGTDNCINILLLGIDRTEDRDKTLGIYRTDTICIVRINLNTKEVKVLCIPRDTYAFVPIENKKDKINHAYAFGSLKKKGVESSVDAINSFIRYSTINYYFALDMEPIPKIVDSLGGVALDVEVDMKTHGANLSKGFQLLNGTKAFDYIHWRYSGNGDIGRIERQQKFVKAMFKKLKNSDKLVECVKLIFNCRNDVKTDFKLNQLISLAILAKGIPEDSVKYEIIPGDGKYINKISYWVPYETETNKLLKEFFS